MNEKMFDKHAYLFEVSKHQYPIGLEYIFHQQTKLTITKTPVKFYRLVFFTKKMF